MDYLLFLSFSTSETYQREALAIMAMEAAGKLGPSLGRGETLFGNSCYGFGFSDPPFGCFQVCTKLLMVSKRCWITTLSCRFRSISKTLGIRMTKWAIAKAVTARKTWTGTPTTARKEISFKKEDGK